MTEETTEIEWFNGQVMTVTYGIWEAEPTTLEHPGCDGGIEVFSVENSRGNAIDLEEDMYEWFGEQVLEQLQDYADCARIERYEWDRENP